MLRVETQGDSLTIYLRDRAMIAHSPDNPFIIAGKGTGHYKARGGHWKISDRMEKKYPLTKAEYDQTRNAVRFSGRDFSITLQLAEIDGNLHLTPVRSSAGLNRLTFSFPAEKYEGVYGGGAQYGPVNLRGHRLPLWVQEKRVGRETLQPLWGGQGHHATYFPMPFFFTQSLSFVYIKSSAYGFLHFKDPHFHRAELWQIPTSLVLGWAETPRTLLGTTSKLLGRQPVLPHWCTDGVWMEVDGGMTDLVERLERTLTAGARVSAICVRDWSGARETPKGQKPFYDWVWNRDAYPKLDQVIRELSARNIRVLAYITPHLAMEGRLFAEASHYGYLVRKQEGGNYIHDMGGFMAGHLDLTNPEACAWFKEVIKENILKLGFSGYCADMGEFLPPGAVLHNGESPELLHNQWPVRWAKLNREAVREAGRSGDAVFFTRSGYAGTSGHTMLSTLGEFNVSWGKPDGFASMTSALLSLACSGVTTSLTEVGGHIAHLSKPSRELLLRWAELAAFTPVFYALYREKNISLDGHRETLGIFAKLSQIHAELAPYLQACIKEAAGEGLPVVRPLFMEFPDEKDCWNRADAYMLGRELFVAPVTQKGKKQVTVTLPPGYWIHLWTGKQYAQGEASVAVPLGKPPVFYLASGKHAELFARLPIEI